MLDRTLTRFILVGVGNTLLGLAVIYAARLVTGDFLANFIGYLVVVPISFFAHRKLSFRDAGQMLPAFLRFLPTVAVGYFANLFVLTKGLAAGQNPHIVQACAMATHILLTYLLSRCVVFLHPRRTSNPP